MKRRQLLQSIGASTGASMIGISGATTSNESPLTEIDNVQVEEIGESKLKKLRSQVIVDREVKKLLQEVRSLGWKPEWDTIRAVRRTVENRSESGSFDTVAIKLEQYGQHRRDQRTHGRTSDWEEEEMFLQWVGNDSLGVEELINDDAGGSAILHLKDELESENKLNSLTGPIADEVTIYEVKNGSVQSATGTRHDNQKSEQKDIITLSSESYCEVDVAVYEDDPSTPCWDRWCLLFSGLGISVTVASCIATGGITCIVGAGVSASSYADCLGCKKEFSTEAEVSESWMINNLPFDDPIEEYCKSPRREIIVTECEFYDIPTKEDYSSPQC